MSQITICDRCGASAKSAAVPTMKTLVLPQADPATTPAAADAEVSIGIVIAPQDLCQVCQASALVEYALALFADRLTPAILAALSARINAVLGFKP